MVYEFDGAIFHVATPDGYVPRFAKALAQSIEHIPYSNVDVIDLGGLQSPTVRCSIIMRFEFSALFESKLGTTGTLYYDELVVQATLLEISNIKVNFDKTHYWCDAVFVQVT